MATLREKLGGKKEAAILALLTARSVEDAARMADAAPRSLHRWLKEPEFQRAYREARRAAYGQATARLQQSTSAAVSTLLKVMIDPASPASARGRGADCIL